jgi:hypothetical protein
VNPSRSNSAELIRRHCISEMSKHNTDCKCTSTRVLPSFLGIGAMRCGTTLLHHLLASHPDIYVPWKRKEVEFFDKHYGKGLAWYASFFPDAASAARYKAIGEITPRYFVRENVPELVKRHLPQAKFIVMLRNPVDRLYSHFRFNLAQYGHRINFSDFISRDSPAVRRGLYAQQLTRWLRLFPEKQFLVFVFEELISDPAAALDKLGGFLGVEAVNFDKQVFDRKPAASLIPRFPQLYSTGIWLRKFLRDRDFDRTYAILRVGRRLLRTPSRSKALRGLTAEERAELYRIYANDISDLETILRRDFDIWRPSSAKIGSFRGPESASTNGV